MASVIQMPNGRWRALVRRKGFKSQCETWPTKKQADDWAKMIEASMVSGAAPTQIGSLTIKDFIQAYRTLRDSGRPISDKSNEHYQLKIIEEGLGHLRVSGVTPDDVVKFAARRAQIDKCSAYTINMDISKLGTVLRYGGAYLRITPPDIVGTARPLLSHLRLIGGADKRERRPTEDEFERIVEHMAREYGQKYADAVTFAAMTAMRRGEVCAVKKSDINQATRIIPVWRKHPRKGKVLEKVPLLGDAMELALSQPDTEDGRVFPMDPGTLSKYFTWTCRALDIPDLHLHDMRHEGTSRMFESGLSIPQVALVTGHKKWEHLKRYTQLRPEDLAAKKPAQSK